MCLVPRCAQFAGKGSSPKAEENNHSQIQTHTRSLGVENLGSVVASLFMFLRRTVLSKVQGFCRRSAPVAPAKGTATTSSGATSPSGLSLGRLDVQLQSTHTRVLWIGSIRTSFAKVPVKNGRDGNGTQDEAPALQCRVLVI